MDLYSIMRELADSWVLLALTVFFVGVVVFAFRPGSRKTHDDIANIPFRNDQPRSDSPDKNAEPRQAKNFTGSRT